MTREIPWPEALRRIANGEPVQDVLDEKSAADRESFRAFLLAKCGAAGVVALEHYDAKMRDLDLGLDTARSTWHSISAAQRRVLTETAGHGGRLERVGREYRHRDRNQPYRPVYVATIRNLCARELMAWDGGAFDPEAAAALTERGRFVLKHGTAPEVTP